MKALFLLIGFILCGFKLAATDVDVLVKGVNRENVGIYITICNKDNFETENPNKDCYINMMVKVNERISDYKFRFIDVPEGEWVIFGYIDEDNSGKINTTIFGIPTEDVFYISDVTPFLFKGAPSFKNIKSDIKGSKQIIELLVQ